MNARVALIRCESYDLDEVRDAVGRGLSLVGGLSAFFRETERILLKPNLLVGDPPEKCVTTHPAVFQAVAERLIQIGVHLSYGDSPAVGKTLSVARKAGLARVADELGIELADFKTGMDVFFDKGLQPRRFILAKAVYDHDGVISLPKLKTHGLERMTGAVKNQFGCIPGMLKGEFHLKLPDAEEFAKMLVDLNVLIRPKLFIMDGIRGMEGNGPRGGKPRKMDVLLFSSDPIALDATVCRLIHLDPEHVPTITWGMRAGLGTYLNDDIELVGDDCKSFEVPDFNVRRRPVRSVRRGWISRFLDHWIVPRPCIQAEKCVRCGLCVQICPARPNAIFFRGEDRSVPPVYNYDQCIKCYCCQEICPESAIRLKTPILRKLVV